MVEIRRSDTQAVAVLVQRLIGIEPSKIHRSPSPDVWFVALSDGRQVVIKRPGWLNRPGSPALEAWVYAECRRRGVRTPKVLAFAEDPECLIVERLPGVSLPERSPALSPADRVVWARAGEDLRALHEVRLPGFGRLVPGTNTPYGESPRWCPFVDDARDHGLRWLVDVGYLSSDVADTLTRRFDEAQATFRQITEGRLLHGDLECHHIFSSEGTYLGIIDFGQAQSGDPRWDLARILLWDGHKALNALLDGYGPDILSTEDRQLILPIYLFAYAVHHTVGHDRPDYIRRLLDHSGYRALL